MIKINGYSILKHPKGFSVDCDHYLFIFPKLKYALEFVTQSILYDCGYWYRGTFKRPCEL